MHGAKFTIILLLLDGFALCHPLLTFYAEQEGLGDLQGMFAEIAKLTKNVKAEIYRLLVEEFRYFE